MKYLKTFEMKYHDPNVGTVEMCFEELYDMGLNYIVEGGGNYHLISIFNKNNQLRDIINRFELTQDIKEEIIASLGKVSEFKFQLSQILYYISTGFNGEGYYGKLDNKSEIDKLEKLQGRELLMIKIYFFRPTT